MLALIRSLTAPLLSLLLLISASGLLNTFISVRLEIEGFNKETIGIVSSALYIGILTGSIWLAKWIGKVGHVRAFIAFSSTLTVLVLAQSLWVDPYYWSALRFIAGNCTAGIFIVIESWLLVEAPASLRGAILSVYLAVFYSALSGGQLLINLSDIESSYPFLIGAFLSGLSILPLLLKKISEPKIEETASLNLIELFRLSPFGFFGGVVSGMILAAVYALVPVYCKETGLSVSQIGNLMALLIFGGLSFQWPFGRWADKGDRRRVLLISSLMASIFGFFIAFFGTYSLPLLFLLSYIFGGFAFTIYPLSMAYVCEKLTDDQIVPATGGFVLSYSFGAIAGPLVTPFAMDLMGNSGLFYFLGLISFLLVLIGLKKYVPVPASKPED